ncbi:MAG: 4-alpha-glucanotransferase [Chlamydiota bacterium]|nr:4-alpha-glucanotransferase [Chlamydiota bacterium]
MEMQKLNEYQNFLSSESKLQWERIGNKRRAGVASPLFSIYSSKSLGIGEIPDLRLMIDWCRACGLSILQLLPMNDTGFDFTPYDAQSTFALDPVYLNLNELQHVNVKPFLAKINQLRKKFPTGQGRVNYRIKKEKLAILKDMFHASEPSLSDEFQEFKQNEQYWLEDYVLFKVIKEKHDGRAWETWDSLLRDRDQDSIKSCLNDMHGEIEFQQWLQWQLYEQFRLVKNYANEQNVLLMGDLPFLVSRDSADVWAHPDYFKLDRLSGAPPDMYFANGQRWGMPPYQWDLIAGQQYQYLVKRLAFAENFYDMYRIDHAVGMFRIWTIASSEPIEQGGLNGSFDPGDESVWEEHGKKLLDVMLSCTSMLPCAEDLGTIPDCSFRVLAQYGIPGMDVQRWRKDWGNTNNFLAPEVYRENSISVISTHDMTPFTAWWEYESGTVDGALFERKCKEKGIDFEQIKLQLFDLKNSHYNKLRWNPDIRDTESLLSILGVEDAYELLDMYKGSFEEKEKFWTYLDMTGPMAIQADEELIKLALKKVFMTQSIFSIQLLQDFLSLGGYFQKESWSARINFPGTVSETNWTLTMPLSLEEMLRSPINKRIKDLIAETQR